MIGKGGISLISGLALLLITSSCFEKTRTRTEQDAFYLEDLIEHQVRYFTANHFGIRKITRLGDREEITEIYPDSLEWTKELNILKEVDISKPGLRPFYDLSTYETPTYRIDHYVLNDSGKSNILYQKVFRDKTSDKPVMILAEQYVRNPIYRSERMIELIFESKGENTIIDSIRVTGYQKMIARDTAYYSLIARIIP